MNLKQKLKDLKNHIDYNFKNKQNFRKKQNQVADIIFYKIVIIYLVIDIIIDLVDYVLRNNNITIPLLSSLLAITGLAVVVYITIEHPFLSYTLLVPLIDIGVAYYIAKLFVQFKVGVSILYSYLRYILYCIHISFTNKSFQKNNPTISFYTTYYCNSVPNSNKI